MTKEYGTVESDVVSLDEFRQNRVATGGSGPPAKPGDDYLSRMVNGTEFLCRDLRGNTPKWFIHEWIFGGLHSTGNVLLIPPKTANDNRTWVFVDPTEFCKAFEFRGILEVPEDDG